MKLANIIKHMTTPRLICLGFIAAATVFASLRGGAFSYALFYASLSVPLTCLIYLIFVYAKLRVHQEIDSKVVIKGEKTKYKFILSNETLVHFASVRAEFLSDYSRVDLQGCDKETALVPGEKNENLTELVCLYRGEYKAGIKSLVIKDYLDLFSLRFRYPSTMNMRVYPRVVKLNSLGALSFSEDVKALPFTYKSGEEQDPDPRAFVTGDSINSINWRVSAKRGELYTRRRSDRDKERIAIFIDTAPIKGASRIPFEDRILEAALAIADFYQRKRTDTEIIYATENDALNRINITSNEGFNIFYDACLTLPFNCKDAHKYLANTRLGGFFALVLITSKPEVFYSALTELSSYMQVCLILTGNRESHELSKIRDSLGKAAFIHIPENCEINEILS